jgi:hypothetical protein
MRSDLVKGWFMDVNGIPGIQLTAVAAGRLSRDQPTALEAWYPLAAFAWFRSAVTFALLPQ